jgi:transcriptional regulator with XRE-family HTH domain
MLNIQLLQEKRQALGLSGAQLATLCGVTREAVSNWLNGDSEPRPSKAVKLANALGLTLREVLGVPQELQEPVVAYRTRSNRAVSGDAAEAAKELAESVRRLRPFIQKQESIRAPRDNEPKASESHVRAIASEMRSRVGLSDHDVVEEKHLLELFRHFGAILVPVFWGLDRERHENALSVYLPDEETSFVVFNIGCHTEDYLYWMSHELGHCLSLHSLQGKAGEDYAEFFAQHFLFTPALAAACSKAVGSQTASAAFKVVDTWAERHGISAVTVLRAVDKYRLANSIQSEKLESPAFWQRYQIAKRSSEPVVRRLCGVDTPSASEVVALAESKFRSPVYAALGKLQRAEGGRCPPAIQSTLMLEFEAAMALSVELWRTHP